MFSFRSMTS